MKISVIIPCYNVEKFLSRCLNSVFTQTLQPHEIIAVNDGSTDGTLQLLQQYVRSNGIKLIDQSNQGAPAARNAGLAIATGDYIQFLDADDVLLPAKLEHQQRIIANKKPVLLVGAYYKQLDSGENTLRTIPEDNYWVTLLKGRLGCTCSNLWSRKEVMDVGGWNQELKSSQEFDLMMRLMLNHSDKVLVDQEHLTQVYERKQGSISFQNKKENWERLINLRMKVVESVKQTVTPLVKKQLLQVMFECLRMYYKIDHTRALKQFAEFKQKNAEFFPVPSEEVSSRYISIYRLIGFKGAEALINLMKKR